MMPISKILKILYKSIYCNTELKLVWIDCHTNNFEIMDEEFEIPVLHNNKELSSPSKLLKYGYSYKIEVDINGTKVFFEPDEERNWRALIAYEEIEKTKNVDRELLN